MSQTQNTQPSVRTGRWLPLQIVAPIFFVAATLEVILAGYGVFGASGQSLEEATTLDVHRELGEFMAIFALLTVVAAILTRNRRLIIGSVVALLLAGVTGTLAGNGVDKPAFGALHVLVAFLIVGLSGWLSHKAFNSDEAKALRQSR